MAITRPSAPLAAVLTLEEVKRHLRIEHDDDDAYLADLAAAVAEVRGEADRQAGVQASY